MGVPPVPPRPSSTLSQYTANTATSRQRKPSSRSNAASPAIGSSQSKLSSRQAVGMPEGGGSRPKSQQSMHSSGSRASPLPSFRRPHSSLDSPFGVKVGSSKDGQTSPSAQSRGQSRRTSCRSSVNSDHTSTSSKRSRKKVSLEERNYRRKKFYDAVEILAAKGFGQEMFREFDHDRSGDVSADEFQKMSDKYNLGLSKADCQAVVNYLDSDGNGTFDYQEFNTRFRDWEQGLTDDLVADEVPEPGSRITSVVPKPHNRKLVTRIQEKIARRGLRLPLVFFEADKNRDGFVSRAEFRNCMARMNFELTDQELDYCLHVADYNRDNYINYHEFAELFTVPNFAPNYDPFGDGHRLNFRYLSTQDRKPIHKRVLDGSQKALEQIEAETSPGNTKKIRNEALYETFNDTRKLTPSFSTSIDRSETRTLLSSGAWDREIPATVPKKPSRVKDLLSSSKEGMQSTFELTNLAAGQTRKGLDVDPRIRPGGFWQSVNLHETRGVVQNRPTTSLFATEQQRLGTINRGASMVHEDLEKRAKERKQATYARHQKNKARLEQYQIDRDAQHALHITSRIAGMQKHRLHNLIASGRF